MNRKFLVNKIFNDFYTKKSLLNNYRSRSWFKIKEINDKYKILKKNINVVDIGSSPGGWSKYISNNIGNGKVFSCDILPMDYIKNVNFYKGNIFDKKFLHKFINIIKNNNINVVVSDISPNISGFYYIDIPKIISIANLVLEICLNVININCYFVLKLFNGSYEINNFLKKIYYTFEKVSIFKPYSSRKNSSEFYIIANNIKKNIY